MADRECPCEAGGLLHVALFGDPKVPGDSGMRGDMTMVKHKLDIVIRIGVAVIAAVGLAVVGAVLSVAGVGPVARAQVQTVNQSVGLESDKAPAPHKVGTTAWAAWHESVSADTIRRWIRDGWIVPPPVKDENGDWIIAEGYRVERPVSRASLHD